MRGGALFFSLSKSESSNVFSLLRPRCSSSGAFTPALHQTAKKQFSLAVSEEKRAPKRSQALACGAGFFRFWPLANLPSKQFLSFKP
jgi:hypothetical protein